MFGLSQVGADNRGQAGNDFICFAFTQIQRGNDTNNVSCCDAESQTGLKPRFENIMGIPIENDTQHEPFAADFQNSGKTVQGLGKSFLQLLAYIKGILNQVLIFDDAQDFQCGAHRQRIAAEGGSVVAGFENVFCFFADNDGTDRHTAGKPFARLMTSG